MYCVNHSRTPVDSAGVITLRALEMARRARDFNQMQRVDDSRAPSRRNAPDRLRIIERRIHPRRWIEKPRAQMQRRVLGIALLLRDEPRRSQRRHNQTQPNQRLAMVVEILRVRVTVAADVRPIGILCVGPPVIAFRKIIVLAALAARRRRGRHCDGRLGKVLIRGAQNPFAVDLLDFGERDQGPVRGGLKGRRGKRGCACRGSNGSSREAKIPAVHVIHIRAWGALLSSIASPLKCGAQC